MSPALWLEVIVVVRNLHGSSPGGDAEGPGRAPRVFAEPYLFMPFSLPVLELSALKFSQQEVLCERGLHTLHPTQQRQCKGTDIRTTAPGFVLLSRRQL
ncbi:uncharacterized [Tachysurus ichikawai]